jgi:hypothetical protein
MMSDVKIKKKQLAENVKKMMMTIEVRCQNGSKLQ